MRRISLPSAVLVLCVGGPLGCGQGKQCPAQDQICADDGKLYCLSLPAGRFPLDKRCCAGGGEDLPSPDAAQVVDAGPRKDSGPVDAAAHADAEAVQPIELGADGGCGDIGSGTPAPDLKVGRDDAGLGYVYLCGIDVCRLPRWDAGQDGALQCGPLGCQ